MLILSLPVFSLFTDRNRYGYVMFIVNNLANLGPLDGMSVLSRRVYSRTSIIHNSQLNNWARLTKLA